MCEDEHYVFAIAHNIISQLHHDQLHRFKFIENIRCTAYLSIRVAILPRYEREHRIHADKDIHNVPFTKEFKKASRIEFVPKQMYSIQYKIIRVRS